MITGSTSLGSLVVYLQANSTQFDRSFREAEAQVNLSGGRMIKAAAAVGAGMATAITAFAVSSVKAYAEFDNAMTKSVAIMGKVSASTRKEMEKTARVLSTQTATSAAKAAEAYYFLASAGMNAEQAMASLAVVERFGAAGAFDMAKATEILADAHSALGLRVQDTVKNIENLTRVSDVLVEAANRSNGSVQQFGEALTTKAAAALRNLNKEVEEGVAVLAVYADQGIKGSLAGEKLAIILRDTQTAARENAEAWKSLGVSAFDAQGAMLPIVDIVEDLENLMGPLSDQAKSAAFALLGFNDRSVDAFKSLLGTTQKIREYEAAFKSAGGVTQKVAETQLTSFSQQMQILKNRVTEVQLAVGEGLMPQLVALNNMLKKSYSETNGFSNQVKSLADDIKVFFEVGLGSVMNFFEGVRIALAGLRIALMEIIIQVQRAILLTTKFTAKGVKILETGITLFTGKSFTKPLFDKNIKELEDGMDTMSKARDQLIEDFWKGFDGPEGDLRPWEKMNRRIAEAGAKLQAEMAKANEGLLQQMEQRQRIVDSAASTFSTTSISTPSLTPQATATSSAFAVPDLAAGVGFTAPSTGTSAFASSLKLNVAVIEQATVAARNWSVEELDMLGRVGEMRQALVSPYEQAAKQIEAYAFLLKEGKIEQSEFNKAVQLFAKGIDNLPKEVKELTSEQLELLASSEELKKSLMHPYEVAAERIKEFTFLREKGRLTEEEYKRAVDSVSLGVDNLAERVKNLSEEQLEIIGNKDQLIDALKDPFEIAIEKLERYQLLLKEGVVGMTPQLLEQAKQQAFSGSQFFSMPATGLPGAGGGAPGVPGPGAQPQGFDQFSGFMGMDQTQNDLQRLQNQEELLRQSYERQKQIVIDATTLTEEERLRILKQGEENFNRMSQQYNTARNHLLLTSAEGMFSDLADIAKNAAGEQSGIYKMMFAASKAFAIADSMVKIQQAIASAAAAPWPANIAAIAQVVSLTAGLIGNIQSVMMTFEGGGYTPSGPRSGGVDGRGGFLAVMHPDEKVTDLTREREQGDTTQSGEAVNIYITQTFTGGVTEHDLARAKEEMKRETAVAVLDGISRGGQFRKGIRR